MPQRVEVKGLGIVEFPDGTPPAVIKAAIQKAITPKTVSEQLKLLPTVGEMIRTRLEGNYGIPTNAVISPRKPDYTSQPTISPGPRDYTKDPLAQSAINMAAGFAMPTVFHGSPHFFEKFDASKIGTGEGAQAFGHGLYFAESPGVAKSYQNKLAKPQFTYNGGELNDADPAHYAAQWIKDAMGGQNAAIVERNRARAIAQMEDFPERFKEPFFDEVKKHLMVKTEAKVGLRDLGYLYRTDIPDEQVAKMLDWDKPLSKQDPSVQKIVREIMPQGLHAFGESRVTGEGIYGSLVSSGWDGTRQTLDAARLAASNKLREAGITGIKYLDQDSRAAGIGTRNYVVFDPNILGAVTRK